MENLESDLAHYALTFEILDIFGLAFLLALVSEAVWDVVKGRRKKLGESFLNGFIAIVTAVLAYQSWIHTEKLGKLGWVDKVLNTPSTHRVHHGANPQYIDKSYGGILIIWDRIFGTYAAEGEAVVYGITAPLNSVNPLKVMFAEYGNIWRDVRKAKGLREAFGYIFKGPGWHP